jgi:hypothetical protein
MNKEAMYNILLNSQFKYVKKLCAVNNDINVICQDEQFWKDKLINDQIVNSMTICLIQSYKQFYNDYYNIYTRITHMLKNKNKLTFVFNNQNLSFVSHYLQNCQNCVDRQLISFNFYDGILGYLYYVGDKLNKKYVILTDETLLKIVTLLIYFYPNVKII